MIHPRYPRLACPSCRGHGRIGPRPFPEASQPCSACNATGVVPICKDHRWSRAGNLGLMPGASRCVACGEILTAAHLQPALA